MVNGQERRRGRSVSTNSGNGPITNCNDIRVTYDRRPAIAEEGQLAIPAAQVSNLRAQTSNSGIYVNGWDRSEYQVMTCKAVPPDDPNPTASLRGITTTFANGQLSVDGPSDREWMATLILMVPRLTSLDLQTANGPLRLQDFAGSLQIRASNGPVSLINVGGSVQVTTANGPVSLRGVSGDHRVTAANGPVDVQLTGSRWEGPGLEVSSRNGPMSVSIPTAYASGIRIQTSQHSPVSCRASVCAGVTRTLGSPSLIQIGSGEPLVRLSGINGPVAIRGANE
jgi:hypothetical protein